MSNILNYWYKILFYKRRNSIKKYIILIIII